eukprot:g10739.t1
MVQGLSNFGEADARRVHEETARRFLKQIASGLFVLHSSNHLHRDLKPQNILLSDNSIDPVLKLADFGFARALQPQDMAATVCGSPLYMAPEILRHEPYDAKADLWSVGAILTPFSGTNPLQLLAWPLASLRTREPNESSTAEANIEKSTALSFEGVQLSTQGQQFLRALLVHSPSQRLSSQEFMQHPYVSLETEAADGSFIMTDWIDKALPQSRGASPAYCSPEESPRDITEEAQGTGFVTASSSAGSGYRGEAGETVKKVEELTASEVGIAKDVPAIPGNVSPFMAEVINGARRDRASLQLRLCQDTHKACAAASEELPRRNGNMDEDYVVLASNTPTSFARGKGPTPALAASSFCSNLNRIARTLEQLALRWSTLGRFYVFVVAAMSFMLPHLHSGWAVDQAILSEEERLVIIRFGHDYDSECMKMDEILYSIAEKIKSFAIIYLVDVKEVPDFNTMYELYDPVTVIDGLAPSSAIAGNNNKVNWAMNDKQEFIDIVETIYRGARKGRASTVSVPVVRLVEQAPVEALTLLVRALSLLEKALKVSLDDDQMGEPLRRDFTRTFATAEKVERQLQAAQSMEQYAIAQPNRAIFESAVQHAKDAAVVLSKGQEACSMGAQDLEADGELVSDDGSGSAESSGSTSADEVAKAETSAYLHPDDSMHQHWYETTTRLRCVFYVFFSLAVMMAIAMGTTTEIFFSLMATPPGKGLTFGVVVAVVMLGVHE